MYTAEHLLTASLTAHDNIVEKAFNSDMKGLNSSALYWGQAELLLNISNYLTDGSDFSDDILEKVTDIIEYIDSDSLGTLYNLTVISSSFELPSGGGAGSNVIVRPKSGEAISIIGSVVEGDNTVYEISTEFDGQSLYDKVTDIDDNIADINTTIGGLGDEYLSKDDTVTEAVTSNGVGDVGGIASGTTIPVGMSFQEFLTAMFVKAIPATYTQSTAVISDDLSNTVEIGQTFSPILTITYYQNDSGAATESRFYREAVLIHTDLSTPFTHGANSEDFSAEGQTLTYSGQVDHSQGVQKYDNLGNPSGDPAVLVPARTGLSAGSTTFYGRRKSFYGKNNAAPVGANDVRGFQSNQFATDNTFSISVTNGDTSVEFAIPSHKSLSSVIFVGALTNDETATFLATEQTVSTNGAENKYPDNYKVYRYVPSVPFGSDAVYNVTTA